jgi:hypothetical protein
MDAKRCGSAPCSPPLVGGLQADLLTDGLQQGGPQRQRLTAMGCELLLRRLFAAQEATGRHYLQAT